MNPFVVPIASLLAQAVEAAPSPNSPQATLLQLIKAGGWVMIPLVIASLITVALVFACLLACEKERS